MPLVGQVPALDYVGVHPKHPERLQDTQQTALNGKTQLSELQPEPLRSEKQLQVLQERMRGCEMQQLDLQQDARKNYRQLSKHQNVLLGRQAHA